MCFFALLDAPGILGILTDEQFAMAAEVVAQESCDFGRGRVGAAEERLGAGCVLGRKGGR